MAELNWSDAQWQKVNDCVTEAFGKASVASAFLPCYGPLAGSTETVRNERLDEGLRSSPPVITLDAYHPSVNLKLVNLTVKVELSSEQVADETLANAMLAFRRAANILAQGADKIVFDGFVPGVTTLNAFVNSSGVGAQKGLADGAARRHFDPIGAALIGTDLVRAVVKAIRKLEDRFHSGPFACVMGNELFDAAHDPSFSLVLPADRITPLLKGPLLRSGQMYDRTGIVVSLAGNAIDIVVGTPPTVQFLQRREDAKFVFRVYERFVLRVRDTGPSSPVAGFEAEVPPTSGAKGKRQSTSPAASPSLAETGLEALAAEITGVEPSGKEPDKKSRRYRKKR
jgi:uncharacterized linocin/CFP29 family protein